DPPDYTVCGSDRRSAGYDGLGPPAPGCRHGAERARVLAAGSRPNPADPVTRKPPPRYIFDALTRHARVGAARATLPLLSPHSLASAIAVRVLQRPSDRPGPLPRLALAAPRRGPGQAPGPGAAGGAGGPGRRRRDAGGV